MQALSDTMGPSRASGDDEHAARAASSWVALGEAFSAFRAGDRPRASSRLGDALADARGADLFADDLVVHGLGGDDVGAFTTWLAAEVPSGEGVAAARLIESRQAEALGTPEGMDSARDLLRAALEANPGYGPARWDAAWHAAVRDDYAAALDHLRFLQVDAADADMRHWEQAAAWRAGRSGGSSPCVCGSGRHQKRCCGKDGMELQLLWWKLRSSLLRAPQRGLVLDVAAALVGLEAGAADLQERLASVEFERALVHPLTACLALTTGGLAARYRQAWAEHSSAAEKRLLDLVAGAHADVWVIPQDGRSRVRSIDGRREVVLRNPGRLARAGPAGGCVVAAVTGAGSRHDAYLLDTPVPLREAPVEGPPIEVAELFHRAGNGPAAAVAVAAKLASFVDAGGRQRDTGDDVDQGELDSVEGSAGGTKRREVDEATDNR